MFEFFRCVAEAVAAHGASGLVDMVPGGAFASAVAADALKRLRERRREAEILTDVKALARASANEARVVAEQVARETAGVPENCLPSLALFLTHIPPAVRQSQKRPEDPSGATVANGFGLQAPEDMAKLLPPRPPRFAPGAAPDSLRGWVLEELLGVGGFGEVWRARHAVFDSLLAAVKFAPSLTPAERELLHKDRLINRVMAEAKHPGVVPLLDASLDAPEAPWLRYEYVPGGDLADQIRAWQARPAEERVRQATVCLRELAAALGHFHRLSPPLVHRGLKPSNILTDRSRPGAGGPLSFVPRVVDFGIGGVAAARLLAGEATCAGRLLSSLRGSHTPLYASPQQRDGEAPDPRDDVHALGVIGCQMITGCLDRGAGPDFAADLAERGASEGLIAVLNRCVAPKAVRRWKDAGELAERLDKLLRPVRGGTGGQPANQEEARVVDRGQQEAAPFADVAADAREYEEELNRDHCDPFLRKTAPMRLARWREAMKGGNSAGATMVAACHRRGIGAARNDAEAVRLLLEAAGLGFPLAQLHLGWMHQHGQGVGRDYAKALEWYRKAAEQGSALAHNDIGWLTQNGWGTPQDPHKALGWYRKAAERGCAFAQNNLGWLYHNGWAVQQDFAKAGEWYRKAAEQGHPAAQDNLGWLYREGKGVPRDYALAMEWHRKAADQGNLAAQASIGWLYREGLGVPQDHALAMEWYRKAAAQGNVFSQFNIGWLYQNGLGVEKDYGKAMEWYRKAADQGYADAQMNIGWLYREGWGVPQDYAQAMQWYRRAADQGKPLAQTNVAWLYETGRGVDRDVTTAMRWYHRAAEQNEDYARKALKRLMKA
jgi:TPR repeat protein